MSHSDLFTRATHSKVISLLMLCQCLQWKKKRRLLLSIAKRGNLTQVLGLR